MSAPVCQFVDRVGTGAVQRLNLNDGKKLTLLAGPDQRPGPDFSPPALKRAVVNTLLVEGASIPASAYDNRIIRLPLRVTACNEEEMAEILETLHRELDRGQNVLKWHPTYNSRPVYFRTFRSPDYRLDQTMEGRGELKVTLALLAEPFAYGPEIESAAVTINNDPAAIANPQYMDITGILGDVLSPLYCYSSDLRNGVIAIRRHGTPGSNTWFVQAEAMVQGLDTGTPGNDATASGAGNNYSRTTFATAALRERLTQNIPAAGSSVEFRGTYRLFARVRQAGAGALTVGIQARFGVPGLNPDLFAINKTVTWGPGDTSWNIIDLGLIKIPFGPDPVYDGASGTLLPVEAIELSIYAERTAGAISLDWDYFVWLPADEELMVTEIALMPAGVHRRVVDGLTNVFFIADAASGAVEASKPSLVGSIPKLAPDQTNRLFVLRQVGASVADAIGDTVALTVSYWPRYLYIR